MREIVQMGYGGQNIQLSSARAEELKDAPNPKGAGYYGLLDLGTAGKLAVMVDVTATNEDFKGERKSSTWGTLYVGKKSNGSLAGATVQPISGCCVSTNVSFALDYGDETAPLDLNINGNISPQYPDPTVYSVNVSFSVMSLRVGRIPAGELFVLDNTSGTANFGKLSELRVLQDLNEDGVIREGIRGEVIPASQAVLLGSTKAWGIHSVSPSGMKVELVEKQTGVLTGKVRTFLGTNPIAGASVRLWPVPFEATTKEDGTYQLTVYEGAVWKVLVTKEGRVPFEASSWPGQYKGQDQESLNLKVRAGQASSYNMELAEFSKQASGSVTLEGYGAFYTALGLVFRSNLGDFQFQFNSYQTNEGLRIDAQVCACEESQRGLAEMGGQGSTPLDQIIIPPFGYTQNNWVQLKVGQVYIARAREGLEGHFVVFRVDSLAKEGVKITYLFR